MPPLFFETYIINRQHPTLNNGKNNKLRRNLMSTFNNVKTIRSGTTPPGEKLSNITPGSQQLCIETKFYNFTDDKVTMVSRHGIKFCMAPMKIRNNPNTILVEYSYIVKRDVSIVPPDPVIEVVGLDEVKTTINESEIEYSNHLIDNLSIGSVGGFDKPDKQIMHNTIPKERLLENGGEVYDVSTDTVFSLHGPDNTMDHPAQTRHWASGILEDELTLKGETFTTFKVFTVDKNNRYGNHYINMNGCVTEIHKKVENTKTLQDGIYICTPTNSKVQNVNLLNDYKRYGFDEDLSKVMVFKTKADAISAGDFKSFYDRELLEIKHDYTLDEHRRKTEAFERDQFVGHLKNQHELMVLRSKQNNTGDTIKNVTAAIVAAAAIFTAFKR